MMLRLLTENFGWKLLSLALASLIWFAVVGNPEVATSVSVPVQYKNLPRYLEMSSEVIDKVLLEVHGPSNILDPESLSDMAVVLDLRDVHRPGEHTFTIQKNNVNLPPGVSLYRALPAQVRLRFETRLVRDVGVQARIGVAPPEGYVAESVEVVPSMLRILGPESRVREIEVVQTDALDLSAVVSRAEFRVNAYVADPQVRFSSIPAVTVRVTVNKKDPGKK